MFLNLHSKNPRKLSIQPNFGRQTYLSHNSLSKLNKEKSYSTASLKEEFRKYKHKSLSHGLSNSAQISQIKSTLPSSNQMVSKEFRAPYSGSSFMRTGYQNGGNLKINDFKKSYLNLDSKLSKIARPKDYFKSIQQTPNNCIPASYIDAEKRIQAENTRKQLTLLDEISALRHQNEILKRQNQELRKQRAIDLDLIARQNQIMQKQEELIQASQEAINAKQVHMSHRNRQNDHGSYTFSESLKQNFANPLDCEHCLKIKGEHHAETQSIEIKLLKTEEENKYLKNEIHELVFQCENYKEALKKAQEKYQKELEQNQKLVGLIYESNKQKNMYDSAKKSLNRQFSPSYKFQKELFENKPISIKKEKGKLYYPQSGSEFISSANTPKKTLGEKSSNTKSAINLLKFSDQTSEEYENWEDNVKEPWEKKYFKKSSKFQEKKIEKERKQKNQNMEWCQNQNIRKFLSEINKQKAKEIDKIDYLLRNQ